MDWKLNKMVPLQYAEASAGTYTVVRTNDGFTGAIFIVDLNGKQIGYASDHTAALKLAEAHAQRGSKK